MEALITGGAFLGAILGHSFNVLALVPVSIVAIAVLLLGGGLAGTEAQFFLCLVGLLISLELGYVTGLLSPEASAIARALYRCLTR